jgi:hypothetical protein
MIAKSFGFKNLDMRCFDLISEFNKDAEKSYLYEKGGKSIPALFVGLFIVSEIYAGWI